MALSVANVVTGNPVQAVDVSQFYSLLIGTMTDQPVTLSDGLVLGTGGTNAGLLDFIQVASPAAPGANKTRLYMKADGQLYLRANGGAEAAVGGTLQVNFQNAGDAGKKLQQVTSGNVQTTNAYTTAFYNDITVNWAATFGTIPKVWAVPKAVSAGILFIAATIAVSTTQATIRVGGFSAGDNGTIEVFGWG